VDAREVLVEGYERLPGLVRAAVEGLGPQELAWAPAPGANSVGWLVWHLIRGQDAQLAEVADAGQVYADPRWAPRFGRPVEAADTGYGHTATEAAAVRPESAEALLEYHDAVHARARAYLADLTDGDLDRVVDRRWDPPVTLGVRLVSILDDCLQHIGQAAYLRGLLDRH
jgi:uncharacterized damage-inducible protein DinB